MELKPRHPPGHANRKLRGHVSEIARLRAEGYTIRAIHEALHDAGIVVGWGTVQREVQRLEAAPSPGRSSGRQSASKRAHSPAVYVVPEGGVSTGAAVDVDSHFDRHITNPLFNRQR